jgi:uncharacterized protein (TIGR02001 family)
VQGGIDTAHSSGFYVGFLSSGMELNTYIDANTEIDVYSGLKGDIPAIEKLGYTIGLYNYFYPGATWKKYNILTTDKGKRSHD